MGLGYLAGQSGEREHLRRRRYCSSSQRGKSLIKSRRGAGAKSAVDRRGGGEALMRVIPYTAHIHSCGYSNWRAIQTGSGGGGREWKLFNAFP